VHPSNFRIGVHFKYAEQHRGSVCELCFYFIVKRKTVTAANKETG